jgi:hypothetical protein
MCIALLEQIIPYLERNSNYQLLSVFLPLMVTEVEPWLEFVPLPVCDDRLVMWTEVFSSSSWMVDSWTVVVGVGVGLGLDVTVGSGVSEASGDGATVSSPRTSVLACDFDGW